MKPTQQPDSNAKELWQVRAFIFANATELKRRRYICCFILCFAFIIGCSSTPEKRQAKEQREIAEERHKVDRELQKEAAEQKRWQQKLSPYSDAQLRSKVESLEDAVARGTAALGVLLQQGNGIGFLIGKGEFEEKVKERDAVKMELVRRGASATESPRPRSSEVDLGLLKGSGSGFFISDDGYFVTCQHVVENASKVFVQTATGKQLPAKLVRMDRGNDLAVLKVDGSFPALPIVSSRTTKLGDSVLTIGFPIPDAQGYEPKFTRGEISSLTGIQDDPRCFQISVAIQPGNSGGPLVNVYGNVVGVISAKLRDFATLKLTGALPQNVNYAVKSSFLNTLLESLPDVTAKLREPHPEARREFAEIVQETRSAVAIVLVY